MLTVTLDQAKHILATEPIGTERYALANSLVSLYASNALLMAVAQEDDATLLDNTVPGWTVSWELNSDCPCHMWFPTEESARWHAETIGGDAQVRRDPTL